MSAILVYLSTLSKSHPKTVQYGPFYCQCTSLLGEAGLTVTSLSRLLIMQSTQIVQIELTEYKYYALSLCRVKASLKRNHSYASATACNINSSSSCQTNITKPSKPASFLCVVSGRSGKTTTQQQP